MKKNSAPLSAKIVLLLVILVIPLNILSLLACTVMMQDSRKAIVNSISSTINTYTDNIDQIIFNTNSLLYELNSKNSDFLSVLEGRDDLQYQLSKESLSNTIKDRQSLSPMADCVYLYQKKRDDLLVVPHNSSSFEDYLFSHNYFNNSQIAYSQWHLITIEESTYFTTILSDGDVYYGAFINLDDSISGIYNYLNYPIQQIIFTEDTPYQLSYIDAQRFLTISAKCSRRNLYLNLVFERSVLTRNISRWRWALFGIIVLYIILVPVLYRHIKKWILVPLTELNNAHLHLADGDEHFRITQQTDSREFTQAYFSFNSMADSLENLRLEKINNELAYKQMLLDNLQLQIRPHFLLNTFNLLYSMIQTQKTEPALEMILYLSQYFRNLFHYNNTLELFPKEWDLIQQYLRVSRFRHLDAFTFQYKLDPEINYVRVPPLLLHNFFENILNHALIHGQVVHIMFNGFYEDGIVTFQIADDGRGIPEDEVKLINSGQLDGYHKGPHVGLRNSITRIKFFYNQQGIIHVDSTVNEGTIFTITFPYDLEEDIKNETFDGE